MVVAIGVFKLVKTAILLALGIFVLIDGNIEKTLAVPLAHLTHWTGAFSGRHVFQHALARLLSLDERTIHRLGIASLVYAVVFATEGVGLILRRRWAEWLTIGVTGSFVPIEVYELVRFPSRGKVAALVINVAIVAYLALRRVEARHPRATRGPSGPTP